jgi:transposase
MPPSDRPTPEEVFRLVGKLRNRIVDRLILQGVSTAEARARLETALRELVVRWNRVGDRERWLLRALERKTRKPTTPRKEH